MKQNVIYPLYRKYSHGRTYFKVISESEWEEVQVMGNKYSIHQFKATILPDRNYIHDLTFDFKSNWIEIDEKEYEHVKKKAQQST